MNGQTWSGDSVQPLPLELLDERLQRYRLVQPGQERALAQSLQRYGQISPVVICIHEKSYVLVDGFKRLRAARRLQGMQHLDARRLDVDEQGAKAAMYNLNRSGQRPVELEESWIVHALVREDGLSQVEAAQLLGRHKSWVNRRLAMLERLCQRAKDELRLGLLMPAIARQLTRLPRGNQEAVLQTAREASLTSRELAGVVDLLLAEHPLVHGQTGQQRLDPSHRPPRNREEQLAQLRDQFAGLGDVAMVFLEGLLKRQRYGLKQAQRVLALLRSYERRDLLAAMQRAVRHHAYAFSSLERILAMQATTKPSGNRSRITWRS
jgi:hypothetical protein